MRILITGSDGFIGRALAPQVLATLVCKELTLVDLRFREYIHDERVHYIEGSLADEAVMQQAMKEPFDLIFHMACIAGGQAEDDFLLGYEVNLRATMRLLETARLHGNAPVFVYCSSVGVYGALPELVTDETSPRPNWSYGTHKFIGELLVKDYTRKGFIDGRNLRLPGIVARPAEPSGAVSAFLSDLIRNLFDGQAFPCPVSADAVSWWMSRPCCVENLLHGAALSSQNLGLDRTWLMPPLWASMRDVVAAIARVSGVNAEALVTYVPVADVEARFGRLPPVNLPHAEALGFRSDGSLDELVRRALL